MFNSMHGQEHNPWDDDEWPDDDKYHKYSRRLQHDLGGLSVHYSIWLDPYLFFVIINDFRLPPGYKRRSNRRAKAGPTPASMPAAECQATGSG